MRLMGAEGLISFHFWRFWWHHPVSLPSASIRFLSFISVCPAPFCPFILLYSIPHLFLCCHLSILSCPRLPHSHLTIAFFFFFWIIANSRVKTQARKREIHGEKKPNIAAAAVYNSFPWFPLNPAAFSSYQGVTVKYNLWLWGWEKQVPQKTW